VHLAHYVPHKQGPKVTFEPAWQKQAVLGHEQLLEMAVVPGALCRMGLVLSCFFRVCLCCAVIC
jgi:hypothetical protein